MREDEVDRAQAMTEREKTLARLIGVKSILDRILHDPRPQWRGVTLRKFIRAELEKIE